MIKVWDYSKEYSLLRDDILNAVDEVFKSGILIFGPKLEEFEDKFSDYHDCKYGIGVGNCTDAQAIIHYLDKLLTDTYFLQGGCSFVEVNLRPKT